MKVRALGKSGLSVSALGPGARIEAAMPADAVAGERYGAALTTHLDSEH
jgi:hypothetical protein